MDGTAGTAQHGDRGAWSRLFLLWLTGIDLRLTILAVPPVLPLIHRDLALDEKSIAALTGLPVLLFGLAAVPGSLLIARIGARRAAIAGLILVASGAGLRGVGPSAPMLFAMTLAMGVGVSVIQPALPSLVSQWFPRSVALATAVYANGLLIGEMLSASLTIPFVLPLVGGRWEWSFAFWALPVIATAVLFVAATPHMPAPASGARPRWWPDWRDANVRRLGLLQGGGSVVYFACNAFIPDYLHTTHRPDLVNACLTALNAGQLPASFIILASAHRLAGRSAPFIVVGLTALLGSGALLSGRDALMVAGAAAIGFSSAFVLILTLALPPLLAAPADVHRLSAGMLAIGYTLTFIVPLLGGAIWDITGREAAAFIPGALGALIVLTMAAALTRQRS